MNEHEKKSRTYKKKAKELRNKSRFFTEADDVKMLLIEAADAIDDLLYTQEACFAELNQCHENLRRGSEILREQRAQIDALKEVRAEEVQDGRHR